MWCPCLRTEFWHLNLQSLILEMMGNSNMYSFSLNEFRVHRKKNCGPFKTPTGKKCGPGVIWVGGPWYSVWCWAWLSFFTNSMLFVSFYTGTPFGKYRLEVRVRLVGGGCCVARHSTLICTTWLPCSITNLIYVCCEMRWCLVSFLC